MLTPEQQALAARLWPRAMSIASRYYSRSADYDAAATDAVMQIVRSTTIRDPESVLRQRVWFAIHHAIRAEERRAKHEAGAAMRSVERRDTPALDVRDEVSQHLRRAHPAERAAMMEVLRGATLYRNPLAGGLYRYAKRVRGEVQDE